MGPKHNGVNTSYSPVTGHYTSFNPTCKASKQLTNNGAYILHFYQFHIGDYLTHTAHLEPMEDLAYRRMLDWVYLHESHLPDSVDQIAKIIRMRTHSECIASVLQEFFEQTEYGWSHKRAMEEVERYKAKSASASASARKRWNANAYQKQSDCNANHKPLTSNHKPKEDKRSQVLALGEGVNGWDEWVEYRIQLRKALTVPTARKQVAMLLKLEPDKQLAVINLSITNGWQGLFPEKADGLQKSGRTNTRGGESISLSDIINERNDRAGYGDPQLC